MVYIMRCISIVNKLGLTFYDQNKKKPRSIMTLLITEGNEANSFGLIPTKTGQFSNQAHTKSALIILTRLNCTINKCC